MVLWVRQIIDAAGADLDLVPIPPPALPTDLALTGNMAQHLLADPDKARHLLGWVHEPAAQLIERSVAWHLVHPLELSGYFSADDRAELNPQELTFTAARRTDPAGTTDQGLSGQHRTVPNQRGARG